MRICYVASSYDVFDKNFVQSLNERGHKIDVFVIRPKKIKAEEKFVGVNYHYTESEIKKGFFYKLSYIYSFITSFFKLKSFLNENNVDVLHGGNVQTAGLLCSLMNFKAFLLMPHGSDILLVPNKSFIHKMLTRYVINKSDIITCDAKAVKKRIIDISHYNRNIVIFPWGVDLDIFNPRVKSEIRKELEFEKNTVLFIKMYRVVNLNSKYRRE